MMLVIGSRALFTAGLIDSREIKNSDWDFIADQASWSSFKAQMFGATVEVSNPDVQAFKCMHNGRETYFEAYIVPALTNVREIMKELAPEDFTSSYQLLKYAEKHLKKDLLTGFYWASPEMCLAIKLAHRFKKDNPYFLKTMQHIRFLRNKGIELSDELKDIMLLRQKETLSYNHPVLDTTKNKFFKDDIYTYDHDTIHEAVALFGAPAYTNYMKDGSQVMVDKEKFFALPEEIKLAGVYEETCVLALERSQIPNEFKISTEQSFRLALEKVCTSITSGWFREYAWENYHKVMGIHKKLGVSDYVHRFKKNQDMVKPFVRGE